MKNILVHGVETDEDKQAVLDSIPRLQYPKMNFKDFVNNKSHIAEKGSSMYVDGVFIDIKDFEQRINGTLKRHVFVLKMLSKSEKYSQDLKNTMIIKFMAEIDGIFIKVKFYMNCGYSEE